MAEYVQQTLEEMTNEVTQLERVGLFDHPEIKKIIGKRKRHEYKLRRRVKTKEDFMDYIQYEMNLLSLIAVRRKQVGYMHKKGEIEGTILKRILSLFYIACRNWPQSIDLWLAQIKFVQTKLKNKSMASKLYASLLKVITNKPNLWLMAAKYEFESIYSIESTRHVLQQGIAFNHDSTILWHEYFRLELLFVDFVRRRQELKKGGMLATIKIPKFVEDDTMRDEVKEGKVACTVYSHARKAHPDNFQFAVGFVDIVKQFEWTENIEEHIFTDLFENFQDHPELWETKANRYLDDVTPESKDFDDQFLAAEKKCTKLLRRLLKKQNTEAAWSTYLSVNWRLLQLNKTQETTAKFLMLLSLVEQKGLLSEQWMFKWVELLASQGDVNETKSRFEIAVQQHPQSEHLWSTYIEYRVASGMDIADTVKIFHRARKQMKEESLELWQSTMILCTGKLSSDALTKLYELAVVSHSRVAGRMKENYLNWVFLTQGIKQARKLYKRLRQTMGVTVEFHKLYIHMEQSQCEPDLERMRKAYRHLLHDFGDSSIDAWMNIIELEKSAGDVSKVSVLYTQAVKSLNGDLVEEFIKRHTLSVTSSQPSQY